MTSTTHLRDHRLRIHARGTTEPTGGTVEYTLPLSRMLEVPRRTGPIIKHLAGTTESVPYTVSVLDLAGEITALMAVGGRMALLGRLVEWQVAADGGAWVTRDVSRISDVRGSSRPRYEIELSDESWVGRNTSVFMAGNSTVVVPGGLLHGDYSPYLGLGRVRPAARPLQMFHDQGAVASGGGRFMKRYTARPQHPIPDAARQFVVDDALERSVLDNGFRHLRLQFTGGPSAGQIFEINTFSRNRENGSAAIGIDNRAADDESQFHLWLTFVGLPIPADYGNAQLIAPTAPPSELLPMHIDGSHPHYSNRPFVLLAQLCQEIGMRYDAAQFAALDAQNHGLLTMRVTGPMQFEDVAREIYFRTGTAPFWSLGRLSPRSIRQPRGIDPTTLFTFGRANVRDNINWSNTSRDVVNSIEFDLPSYKMTPLSSGPRSADLLEETREGPFAVSHDNVEELRARPVQMKLSSVAVNHTTAPAVDGQMRLIARELFDFYGDGPIRCVVPAMESAGGVQPGDYVVLNQDELRGGNPETGARSSLRLALVLRRTDLPNGYDFELLDAGPSAQPLATPSVAIAQNAGDPLHAVDVTVSGVPTGARAVLELGYGESTPGDWPLVVVGVQNGTTTVRPVPAETRVWVRAYSIQEHRTRSGYSVAASVVTVALPAPTGLSAEVFGRSARLTFTPAEGYAVMPVVGLVDWRSRALPAGTTTFVFDELPVGEINIGVYSVDAYGGRSVIASVPVTIVAGTTLPPPRRLALTQARRTPNESLPAEEEQVGFGLEVELQSAAEHAQIRVQLATDEAFGAEDVEIDILLPAGVLRTYLMTPLDDVERFVQARHEREGYTPSIWTPVVSGYPTALLPGGSLQPVPAVRPYFDRIRQFNPDTLLTSVYGRVIDPAKAELPGVLRVWNVGSNPETDEPDHEYETGAPPLSFGPTEAPALGDIPVPPGVAGLVIWIEWLCDDGRTTGVREIRLEDSLEGLVDEYGQLRVDSWRHAMALATEMANVGVGPELPPDGDVYRFWYLTDPAPPRLYRWAGTGWALAEVDGGAIMMESIVAGALAVGAVTAEAILAGAVRAIHLGADVAEVIELIAYLATIEILQVGDAVLAGSVVFMDGENVAGALAGNVDEGYHSVSLSANYGGASITVRGLIGSGAFNEVIIGGVLYSGITSVGQLLLGEDPVYVDGSGFLRIAV